MPALRETSSATTHLVLEYVREHLGDDGVRAVVEAAAVPHTLEELTDPARWVSYDARIRLFEQATAAVGRPDAMFAVGASALRNGLSPTLTTVLRRLGSPRQVFRSLPRAVGKFSTTSTMRVLDLGTSHAVIHYVLHEGYEHSRLDCQYAQGLFSVVPTVFGLPPARILHEECESDGYPACVYTVTWARRSRWRRRPVLEDPEIAVLRLQLEALQSVADDLVSSDQLEEVLQRITERAASAVLAPAYLLAVESPRTGERLVCSAGLAPERADALAEAMLAGQDLGRSAVVVDVASTRRHHGRLAALNGEGQTGMADEQRMLAAYARHAAAALDLLVAVEGTRRGEARATALLGLSHQLSAASGVAEVADLVAGALPSIVGAEQASVLLWDATAGELRTAACAGLGAEQTELMLQTRMRPDEVPELVEMLTRRQPVLLEPGTTGQVLRQLLEGVGTSRSLVVPLLAGDELLGVASAGWADDTDVPDLQERIGRLAGVADQAATALHSARLVEAIEHQSLHDDLTGLPNRVLLGTRLDAALRSAPTEGCVALLFCDLDRFKQVNDVLGHAAGDELLRQVAARLRGCLRPGDSVGRLSGDEFAVLLPHVHGVEGAEQVAERLVRCFDVPFRIEGRELRVTTSVGVAVQHGQDGRGDRLLREADGAMYVAKQRGRNQIARAELGPAVAATGPSLERELAQAVAQDELRLHYQPVLALRADGVHLTGAEALLRWEHPRLGLLPPAAFLPVAEDTGLVVELDLWALRSACAQARRWADDPALPPVQLAVNLAARTLTDPRLVRAVRAALAASGVRPELLCVEVVESASLVDLPRVTAQLQELRRMGVRTALDDFGTGYSTLSWLQHLPVDRVKLDRSFTAELPEPAAVTLVRGVVALAGELGLEVVAEGVETPEQLAALQQAGCLAVQGYLLGRPAPELRPVERGLAVEAAVT